MSKFLFIVPPLAGHVNPTLGIGDELLSRGHEVAWISFDPELKNKIPDGGTFLLLEADISEDEKERIKNELIETGKKAVYGLDSLKFLYEEILIPMNRGMLEGIYDLIDQYNPTLIVTDQQLFAGAVAAKSKGIKYATSVTAPAAIKVNEALPKVYEWEGEQIVNFQKSCGINDDIRIDCSSLLSLVYTSRLFFGTAAMPENFQFVGPVIKRKELDDNYDWESLNTANDNRIKILVSLGTTFDHSQKQVFFEKVIEAFERENITVVVISDPDLLNYIPENFIVRKQIPQLKVIPLMDVVVCHGGNNTVCETLSYAKPLVILPVAYDQSYVAGCVVNSGAGIRLNFNRFRSLHLKEAVYAVLNEKIYSEKAKAIQQSFAESGGLSKAADLLEKL